MPSLNERSEDRNKKKSKKKQDRQLCVRKSRSHQKKSMSIYRLEGLVSHFVDIAELLGCMVVLLVC